MYQWFLDCSMKAMESIESVFLFVLGIRGAEVAFHNPQADTLNMTVKL